jgi:hypothetical protein
MRSFLGNRFAFGVTVIIFALGLSYSAKFGGGIALPSHPYNVSLTPGTVDVAHGPSLPPNPWIPNCLTAHGPSLPPNPWIPNCLRGHGPSLPPNPWIPNC